MLERFMSNDKLHLDRRVPVFSNGQPMVNPFEKQNLQNPIGIGGILCKNRFFVKVIEFPVNANSEWAAESMYVMTIVPKSILNSQKARSKFVKSISSSGVGILVNIPTSDSTLKWGDTVRYSGGSDGLKAKFIEKVY